MSSLTGAGQGPFKVVQLRNLYDKSGFSLTSDESLSGFGFLHDGSVDTLPQFVAQGMFDIQDIQEVADLVTLLVSFAGNGSSLEQSSNWSGQTFSLETHTITGRQEIFNPNEVPLAAAATRSRLIPLMKFVEEEPSISMIAHGRIQGQPRSWLMSETGSEPTSGSPPGRTIKAGPPSGESEVDAVEFDADVTNSVHTLEDLFLMTDQLSFTIVPQGRDATRLSVDRDVDGLRNMDEQRDLDFLRKGIQNPFDPTRADSTGDHYRMTADGVVDSLNDFDGDGVSNLIEIENGTNPLDGWQEHQDRMRPALSQDQKTDRLRLSWTSQPKTNYHIEASIDMKTWGTLSSEPIQSGDRESRLHFQIPPRSGLTHRYYRVREL